MRYFMSGLYLNFWTWILLKLKLFAFSKKVIVVPPHFPMCINVKFLLKKMVDVIKWRVKNVNVNFVGNVKNKMENILSINLETQTAPIIQEVQGKEYIEYGTEEWRNLYPQFLIDLYYNS